MAADTLKFFGQSIIIFISGLRHISRPRSSASEASKSCRAGAPTAQLPRNSQTRGGPRARALHAQSKIYWQFGVCRQQRHPLSAAATPINFRGMQARGDAGWRVRIYSRGMSLPGAVVGPIRAPRWSILWLSVSALILVCTRSRHRCNGRRVAGRSVWTETFFGGLVGARMSYCFLSSRVPCRWMNLIYYGEFTWV